VIVDDGSTDGTRSVVDEVERLAPFRIRYSYQPNQGPSSARNRGIEMAKTCLLLLTDDDMIPQPDLVATHVEWHRKHSEPSLALLGLVKWSPELKPTPFMKWYGEAGPLFAYGVIRKKRELDFRYFYSCNLSVKTEFLKSFGKFDERFHMAAYEDNELGFRLGRAGLRLFFDARAVAYHYQYFTFADACRKTLRAAEARESFLQTDAGNYFLVLRSRRDSSFIFRIVKRCCALMFKPFTNLLDSHFPLPAIIYRSLFWYHTSRVCELQERLNSSN